MEEKPKTEDKESVNKVTKEKVEEVEQTTNPNTNTMVYVEKEVVDEILIKVKALIKKEGNSKYRLSYTGAIHYLNDNLHPDIQQELSEITEADVNEIKAKK